MPWTYRPPGGSTYGTSSGYETSADEARESDEEKKAAAEQVLQQTIAMLKHIELCQGTFVDAAQLWAARSQASARTFLEQLGKILANNASQGSADRAVRDYSYLLMGTIGRLPTDIFGAWLDTVFLARRNLHIVERRFAEQAQARARSFAQRTGLDPFADAAARGWEKATDPIPLWNYDGYLVCDVQTNSGEPRMVNDEAHLQPSDVDLKATFQLIPEAPEKGAWKHVLVTHGVEPEVNAAIEFVVDVAADDIEVPGPGLVKLVASRDNASQVVRLPLRVPPLPLDQPAPERDTLILYIRESGRHITTLMIPVVFPRSSSVEEHAGG